MLLPSRRRGRMQVTQEAIADDALPLNVLSRIDRPDKPVKMGNVAFS
jgi:hypothetical protein